MKSLLPEAEATILALADVFEPDLDDASISLTFSRLLRHMPIALWVVDSRSAWGAFEQLRADGVTDIEAHLAENPDLVEFACDTVMVSRANDAALRLIGQPSESYYPRSVRHMFEATPQAVVRVMTAHFNGLRTHVEELRINASGGRVVDVLFLVTYPRPPERMDVTFIIMVEITERLVAETQLRQLQADLAHASRVSTLGEMASSIAHEVRQPLGAIILNGNTGIRWLDKGEPNLGKVRHLLERMVANASEATEIIDRIQGMASKRVPVRARFSLNEIVDVALRFIHHESIQRAVAIRPLLRSDLPPVLGDRIQLQQVVVNLLVNAMHAIDQQPRESLRQIAVLTDMEADGRIVLKVVDTGPGIAEEHLDSLFDGFFSTKDDGMGMGLTICASIMRAHDGDIIAENGKDGGAILSCRLPAAGDANLD